MSNIEPMKQRIARLWNQLAEGWEQVRERAGGALTRFQPGADQQRGTRWSLMSADVVEEGDRVIVTLEAPGLERDDLRIDVEDDVLRVSGEKRSQQTSEEGRYHVTECAYGYFERVLPLPVPVTSDGAEAKYKRGVLRITLPKDKQRQPRRIVVAED